MAKREAAWARLVWVTFALLVPIACGAGSALAPAGAGGPAPAGKALVIFGADTVVAEVARTSEERERGLMHRTSVPMGTGMLFVLPDEQYFSFWMRDTPVSLDIAFMDSDLRVIDIQQMEANSEQYHDSKGPAMYGLEVPLGWMAAHGVVVGAQARLVVLP